MDECLLAEDACAGDATDPFCRMRRTALDLCALMPPPATGSGGGGSSDGDGDGDHECGDDEIGGGSEECEACGDGEVPRNGECVACEWGESLSERGRCRCDAESLDALARLTMGNIPDVPWETGGTFVCIGAGPSVSANTISTEHEEEKCILDSPGNWAVGKVAVAHSHPVFAWERDKGKMCAGKRLQTVRDVLTANAKGMNHSGADISYARSTGLPSYLSDSLRYLLVYRKNAEGTWEEDAVP